MAVKSEVELSSKPFGGTCCSKFRIHSWDAVCPDEMAMGVPFTLDAGRASTGVGRACVSARGRALARDEGE